MILPTKHISVRYSLVGVGALVLKQLGKPQTITALWEKVRNSSEIGTFERFTLTLDFLYTIGAIHFDGDLLWRKKFMRNSPDQMSDLYPAESENFALDTQLAIVFEKQAQKGEDQT